MKSYPLITAIALLLAWVGGLGTHALISIKLYRNASAGDTQLIAFWILPFLLIAWAVFILLPKKLIIGIYNRSTPAGFICFTTLYALLSFTLLIGWLFLIDWVFLIVFADAAAIGLVFGFVFCQCWKRAKWEHSPFDL